MARTVNNILLVLLTRPSLLTSKGEDLIPQERVLSQKVFHSIRRQNCCSATKGRQRMNKQRTEELENQCQNIVPFVLAVPVDLWDGMGWLTSDGGGGGSAQTWTEQN
jgi:hypothetical protein